MGEPLLLIRLLKTLRLRPPVGVRFGAGSGTVRGTAMPGTVLGLLSGAGTNCGAGGSSGG